MIKLFKYIEREIVEGGEGEEKEKGEEGEEDVVEGEEEIQETDQGVQCVLNGDSGMVQWDTRIAINEWGRRDHQVHDLRILHMDHQCRCVVEGGIIILMICTTNQMIGILGDIIIIRGGRNIMNVMIDIMDIGSEAA